MTAADLSVFVFGIFLILVDGLGFLAIPNTVLRLFRLPETKEVWIRILGFIIALLGAYYIVGGLYHQMFFEWATVFGRFAVLVFLIILTLLKQAKATIILFGVVDTLGAFWTLIALNAAM
jgi:hypothetical protein